MKLYNQADEVADVVACPTNYSYVSQKHLLWWLGAHFNVQKYTFINKNKHIKVF